MKNIGELIKDLSIFEEIDGIALGGSRAIQQQDKESDYDIYIYWNQNIDSEKRRKTLEKYCDYLEINNTYWEVEDDCRLLNGSIIELIYRNMEEFDHMLYETLINGRANLGYTTCMWHNLMTSKVLYDKEGKLGDLVKKYTIPYPKTLKSNIINKNMELLDGYIPSYSEQIRKAYKRKDLFSVNHRITEFLASYFDIVLAVNEQMHPGEKRLIPYCVEHCPLLPENFEEDIRMLLLSVNDYDNLELGLKNIIKNMNQFIMESR